MEIYYISCGKFCSKIEKDFDLSVELFSFGLHGEYEKYSRIFLRTGKEELMEKIFFEEGAKENSGKKEGRF